MWIRGAARGALAVGVGILVLALTGIASAGQTNLQQTQPLVWVMLGISIGGALLTYAIMAYALWRFRDPRTRGRRYG